jgi:hypothetical protein
MADGRLVPSAGAWTGSITAGDVSHRGTFKIFDSNGAWSALFGKPLLKKLKAVHDYNLDIIKIPKGDSWAMLQNWHQSEERTQSPLPTNNNSSNNQHINSKGDHCTSPIRQVLHDKQSSEPVDVAVSQIAPSVTEGQNIKECSSSKEIISEEQDEQKPKKLETLQAQHLLTQDGNKRRTKDEHAKWRVANGQNEKKSQADRH